MHKDKRNVGLDLYRLLAILYIFLFHSNIHLGCRYGFLTDYIHSAYFYMTAFFLLSGFTLYMGWNKRDLSSIKNMKSFYVRRLIGILPLYYAVSLLYLLFLSIETRFETLLLAPVELLGLQSVLSMFSVSHNGGTWFISCILICWLLYPFIQEITRQLSLRANLAAIAVMGFVLLYSPLPVGYFRMGEIYTNPFFRLLEFSIGALLCSLLPDIKRSARAHFLFSPWTFFVEYLLLIAGIKLILYRDITIGNITCWVALPMFMLQLVTLSGMELSAGTRLSRIGKALAYGSELGLAFFLAQFFVWKLTLRVLLYLGADSNLLRICVSFLLCLVIAVLLHELIEKPAKKALSKLPLFSTSK